MAPLKKQAEEGRTVSEVISEALNKIWDFLSGSQDESDLFERYIHLRMEDIFVFVNCEYIDHTENPHLICFISTDDLAAYGVVRGMLKNVAQERRVGLRFPDEEIINPKPLPSSRMRVRNPVDGQGIFWTCCGCYCFQDTTEEDYNFLYEPADDGFCDFYGALALGRYFDPNCQKGQEIIAYLLACSHLKLVRQGKISIF